MKAHIRFYLQLFCLLQLVGGFVPIAQAAIRNDDFLNRTTIKGSRYSIHVNNTSATAEPSEPGPYPNHSLWWTWTAPKDELICISTKGSAVNTSLAIYQGQELDSLTNTAFSTDWAKSEVIFLARAGTTYQICVDSYWGGSTGKIVLNLFPPKVPSNDSFSGRKLLVGTHPSISGNNHFASSEGGEPPFLYKYSLWYSWKAPQTGTLTLKFFDTVDGYKTHNLVIYTGDILSNLVYQTEWDNPDVSANTMNFGVTAGVTYQIAVCCWFSVPNSDPFVLKLIKPPSQ